MIILHALQTIAKICFYLFLEFNQDSKSLHCITNKNQLKSIHHIRAIFDCIQNSLIIHINLINQTFIKSKIFYLFLKLLEMT